MFNKLLRDLKRLERGVRVPIQVPLDDEGYLDRRCPSQTCHAEFKVLFDDWKDKVADEVAYCAVCRADAPATGWNTDAQGRLIHQSARALLHRTINEAMREDALRFNASQRPGLISLSLSVSPSAPPVVLPAEAADVMRLKSACESCGCRYASIGAAFFCPACGHNSAGSTFDQTVQTVRSVVAQIPTIRAALATAGGEDLAQDSIRGLLEDSLGRLVAAFQRFAEAMYERSPEDRRQEVKKNAFQRLRESSGLWREVYGRGYEQMLAPEEMTDLIRLFQQRHLIAHRDGLVDQDYIDKSGDTTYAVGQRLVVRDGSILRLADLVSKLGEEIRSLR